MNSSYSWDSPQLSPCPILFNGDPQETAIRAPPTTAEEAGAVEMDVAMAAQRGV